MSTRRDSTTDKRQKNQYRLAFPEESRGAAPRAFAGGTESELAERRAESPTTEQWMEEVCERENCKQALRRVKANKGSPGIDGMTVEQLPGYLKEYWPAIREQLLSGTYAPKPVKRVEIPKPDGGVRKLGIPTVLDRFTQQAVMQVLQRSWDGTFSEHSYGFRPKRSAHQLKLIRAFLRAGVMENGLVSPAEEGTPQGGPLSPLLSNIVLDELDRELERRKHRFVRYADDCNIYVRSQRAGQRVMTNVTRFLTRRLKLKVNEAKSAVARPVERKFLGFSFSNNKEPKRRIAPKVLLRCKQKIRELTRRTRGISLEQMLKELTAYLRGWKSYFGFCQTPSILRNLDYWIRRRLRSMIWKQWKHGTVRFRELRRRDVSVGLAAKTAGSAHGAWRLANSPALAVALPNAYFASLGLPYLFDGPA